jgi:hypothetical protein
MIPLKNIGSSLSRNAFKIFVREILVLKSIRNFLRVIKSVYLSQRTETPKSKILVERLGVRQSQPRPSGKQSRAGASV